MLKFCLFLSLFLELNMEFENSKLKETPITNHVILELVKDYINEFEFFNASQIKPSILLKLEHSKDRQIVFLGATFLISYFESNLPNSYAKVGDIVIFIYNDSIKSNNFYSFEEFHKDFNNVLHEDITSKKQLNLDYIPQYFIDPEYWKVTIKDDFIEKKQKVVKFPAKNFSDEFSFDNQGYIIYNDGIYAIAEIPPEPPVGFSLSDYLEKNTSLNLSEYIEITIKFTIDEKGKATDVEIEGIRNSFLKNELIKAIREMPKWSPGKIGNKVVKVRDSYGLKGF